MPITDVEHFDIYSREWWAERLPLIQKYVNGATVLCDGWVLDTPSFDAPCDKYELQDKQTNEATPS